MWSPATRPSDLDRLYAQLYAQTTLSFSKLFLSNILWRVNDLNISGGLRRSGQETWFHWQPMAASAKRIYMPLWVVSTISREQEENWTENGIFQPQSCFPYFKSPGSCAQSHSHGKTSAALPFWLKGQSTSWRCLPACQLHQSWASPLSQQLQKWLVWKIGSEKWSHCYDMSGHILGLWIWFLGETWKILEHESREPLKFCK